MTNPSPPRSERLKHALADRILVTDGGMGASLLDLGLTPEDFGGARQAPCLEHLCKTRPEVVTAVHDVFLDAGADIILTNSFCAAPLRLDRFGLAGEAFDLNRRAAELVRAACSRHETAVRPRWVVGSIGPLPPDTASDTLVDDVRVQASGLLSGGVDAVVLETFQDLATIRLALSGIARAVDDTGRPVPVAVTVTLEPDGTLRGGDDIRSVADALTDDDLLYFGFNCCHGPEGLIVPLQCLTKSSNTPIACIPNAGLPNASGQYPYGPTRFRRAIAEYVDRNLVGVIGGCCGTTPDHIAALSDLVMDRAQRQKT